MPLLIRIIVQRILIASLSFLAFLGFNPDISIPTIEEVDALQKRQEQIVRDVLTPDMSRERLTDSIDSIGSKLENALDDVVDNQTKTQGIVENIVNTPVLKTTEKGVALDRSLEEDVVVNIVCVNRSNNAISILTGSGVVVSPSGIILTNSHVANAFLFNEKNKSSFKDCTVRRENIPTYGFNAELVYLPEDWLKENLHFFNEADPRGSGENDYALLAITSNTNPVLSLPDSFEYVDLVTSENSINKNLDIVVAAYPGLNSGVFSIDSNARFKKADSYIDDLITFKKSTIDVVATGPNPVAKRGSSGGGVFLQNKLLGIVSTTDVSDKGMFINAITMPYIIRDFGEDKKTSFQDFIRSDKNTLISNFKKEESSLKTLIADFF